MLPSSPGFTGPRSSSRPPGSTVPATAASTSYNPNDNNSEHASAPHSCFGAQSDVRLTVGGFNEGGLVTLITADKQFFCLPASLIPGKARKPLSLTLKTEHEGRSVKQWLCCTYRQGIAPARR